MKRSIQIPLFIILAAALLAVVFVAGCGEETATTQQQISCDPNAPSIMPVPQGRPILVEFFRDT